MKINIEKENKTITIILNGKLDTNTSPELETKFLELEDYIIKDILVDNKICSSKREARELITGNSISINGKKITDTEYKISKSIAIDNEIVVIRRGKKKYYIGVYKK